LVALPILLTAYVTVQSLGDIMRSSAFRRLAPIALLAAAVLAVPTAATAVPPVQGDPLTDFGPLVFEAGVACPDFALSVEGSDAQGKVRTFVDRNGDTVRILITGKGYNLTVTNMTSGEELLLSSTGSSQVVVPNADGTFSSTIRGAALIILFPEDVPAGPSSHMYRGRTVFQLEADGTTFISLETFGTSMDICAALS
jgi:hypothetical protein